MYNVLKPYPVIREGYFKSDVGISEVSVQIRITVQLSSGKPVDFDKFFRSYAKLPEDERLKAICGILWEREADLFSSDYLRGCIRGSGLSLSKDRHGDDDFTKEYPAGKDSVKKTKQYFQYSDYVIFAYGIEGIISKDSAKRLGSCILEAGKDYLLSFSDGSVEKAHVKAEIARVCVEAEGNVLFEKRKSFAV